MCLLSFDVWVCVVWWQYDCLVVVAYGFSLLEICDVLCCGIVLHWWAFWLLLRFELCCLLSGVAGHVGFVVIALW